MCYYSEYATQPDNWCVEAEGTPGLPDDSDPGAFYLDLVDDLTEPETGGPTATAGADASPPTAD